MLGVSICLFTAFCIGEHFYKKKNVGAPMFRLIEDPSGEGPPLVQKRVEVHHHHHDAPAHKTGGDTKTKKKSHLVSWDSVDFIVKPILKVEP